jgi:hypothetical protein
MSYFPKHYLKTNQYTTGGEFVVKSTGEVYNGFYFQTGNGKFFTGETPNSPNIFELVKSSDNVAIPSTLKPSINYAFVQPSTDIEDTFLAIPSPTVVDNIDTFNYLKITNRENSPHPTKYLPFYNATIPTQQDYQIGEFRRYFCKKTNQSIYLEISKQTYTQLSRKDPLIEWSLYIPFSLPWSLTGDKQQVYKTNRNIVELNIKKLKLYGFNEYLNFNFTKYYNQLGTPTSGSYIDRANQGYVLDYRNGRSTGVSDSQNDRGSIRRDNSTPR